MVNKNRDTLDDGRRTLNRTVFVFKHFFPHMVFSGWIKTVLKGRRRRTRVREDLQESKWTYPTGREQRINNLGDVYRRSATVAANTLAGHWRFEG